MSQENFKIPRKNNEKNKKPDLLPELGLTISLLMAAASNVSPEQQKELNGKVEALLKEIEENLTNADSGPNAQSPNPSTDSTLHPEGASPLEKSATNPETVPAPFIAYGSLIHAPRQKSWYRGPADQHK